MTVVAELITTLKADAHQFTAGVDEAIGSTEHLQGASDRMAGVGKAAFIALGTAAVAVGALSVKAASDYESANARLQTAIKNTGQSWDEQKSKVEAVDSQMRKLGFTDTDTEGSLATLTQVTKDVGKSTELMGLAADISAGRHIALSAAVNILSRVEQGRVSTLQRLNINVKDNEGRIISQQEAIKRLTDLYGGSASSAADTFAGKLKVLEAQADHVAVAFGEVLIPILLNIANVGAGVIDFFEQNQEIALALAIIIGGPLAAAMAVFIAQQIEAGAVWVFTKIGEGIGAIEALAGKITVLAGSIAGATVETEALTTAQETWAGASAAVTAAQEALLVANEELVAAQAEEVVGSEALEASETGAAVAAYNLAAAEEAAAVAAQELAAAEEEAALAGSAGLGLAAGIGIAVVATAAIVGVAYALGYFDDEVSKATISGEKFGNALVKGTESSHTVADSYKILREQYKTTGEAIDNLEAAQGRLTSSFAGGLVHSVEDYNKRLQANRDALDETTAKHDVYGKALDDLKPKLQKLKEEQAKATQEASVTAAVWGLELPKAFDGTAEQAKALTKIMPTLNTLVGHDAAQAALNLTTFLPGLGANLADAAKQAENFKKTLEGSVASFTNVFANFKEGQSQADFHNFFVQSNADAQKWVSDLHTLIDEGVNQGIIDQLAQLGPKSQPALDQFQTEVLTWGKDWVNNTQQATSDVEAVTEAAYNRMAIHAGIKSAEMAAISQAAFQDILNGGTTSLDNLALRGDDDFKALVAAARAQLPAIPASMTAEGNAAVGAANVMADGVTAAIGSIPKDPKVNLQVIADLSALNELERQLAFIQGTTWYVNVAIAQNAAVPTG